MDNLQLLVNCSTWVHPLTTTTTRSVGFVLWLLLSAHAQEFITPIQLAYLEGDDNMIQLLWERSPDTVDCAASPQGWQAGMIARC